MQVILLDADGVVLHKGEYFSDKYAREYQVPVESILEFFRGPYLECQSGQADLKEVIVPYLEKWGWASGVEEFLNYWFSSDVVINSSIRDLVSRFRGKGIKLYLASNNEKYRAAKIVELLQAEKLLDGYYFSSDLKVRKQEPAFFEKILLDLEVSPAEVTFVDNDQKNVDSAASVGINAYLYSEDLINSLVAKL